MSKKDKFFYQNQTIKTRDGFIDLTSPKIMGIVNLTNDSFYKGDLDLDEFDLIKQIENMVSEGADILDIGANSTRPGSKAIDPNEEIKRILPILRLVRKEFPHLPISIDSFHSKVIKECMEEVQIDIVNDISMGRFDNLLWKTVADYDLTYVCMHMQGTPQTMQNAPKYEDVTHEITTFFQHSIDRLKQAGVNNLILDPGFGFGKTVEHNHQILKNLSFYSDLFPYPILVGLSRKSMIYKILNSNPKNALTGTISLNTIALLNGAKILRVHDAKEAKECAQIVDYYKMV